MAPLIEPRVLKGFRDFLPAAEIERRALTEKIEASFRSFGFVPIDTPALEYTEILLGKGGGETEKQVYRFRDHGDRDVALRFDLTVPFARFMAEHRSELPIPFKRYHIAKVWRGENTQRGRYREFTQCDFDIVGSESAGSDFEILLMMRETLRSIGVGDVTIRLNHRGVFNRFLHHLGVEDRSVEILRTVDKLTKIGKESTLSLLSELIGADKAEHVLLYIQPKATYEDTLTAITEAAGGPGPDTERLALLRRFMEDAGIADVFVLDPSITRGLDYYTGVVYETFLNEIPDIGSVCSGGRYDNLAALYSKEQLPGVGASIGLDRLIAALEVLGRTQQRSSYADVAIACLDESMMGHYQVLAKQLRDVGIPCEVLTEAKKLTQQYVLAEKKGARWVIICPPDAWNSTSPALTLRDLASRQDTTGLSVENIVDMLKIKR
ncbi:MAG: histidine--tRNA ligase [Termitinemataceae bacterium]